MNNIEDIRAEAELRYLLLGRDLENPVGWKRVTMRNLLIDQERRKRKYREVALRGFETLADDADNVAYILKAQPIEK